jgi:hypothetical protein
VSYFEELDLVTDPIAVAMRARRGLDLVERALREREEDVWPRAHPVALAGNRERLRIGLAIATTATVRLAELLRAERSK